MALRIKPAQTSAEHCHRLAAAIQRAGGPLPTMVIGTLPVVIAISSNLRDAQRDGQLPWLKLAPSLALIASGIACVNHVELQHLRAAPDFDVWRYGSGLLLAICAALAVFRFKIGMIPTLAATSMAGAALYLFGAIS